MLPGRERHILGQRYGYRGKPETQKDLGIEFGIFPLRYKILEKYLPAALRLYKKILRRQKKEV